MKATFHSYKPSDFLPIRDFLVANYSAYEEPVNWFLTRWNYARYLCAPMLGAWGIGETYNPDPDTSPDAADRGVKLWESAVGVWKTDAGEIAGVVCPDEYVPYHGAWGQAFLQRTPMFEHLLPEMLEYAEANVGNPGNTRLFVGEHDLRLQQAASNRGYIRDEKPCIIYRGYDLTHLPEPDLPKGYQFVSVADGLDLEKLRSVSGRAFRHTDPREWPTVRSYKSWMQAPDYLPELHLVVLRPDGEYVACTCGWIDMTNRLATVEPLGSVQLGMGREVLMEALRRMRDMGAVKAHMDAGNKFYSKVGFKDRFKTYRWVLSTS